MVSPLSAADARSFRVPVAPTLVVSNPPYGKRIPTPLAVDALLDAVLANVASQLHPEGRIAWISPVPRATQRSAAHYGFATSLCRSIDVGGVAVELQVFVRRRGHAR